MTTTTIKRMLVLACLAAVVALAAAAGGIANLEGLSIDAVPDISPRQVMVLTLSPGLGPLEVERLVTKHPAKSVSTDPTNRSV